MIKEEFGFGDSIEEAQQQALQKLNCGDADYKIEIIEDYKPKVLGIFGGHQAQVRAYYECPDAPKSAKKATGTKPRQTSKPKSERAPKQEAAKETPKADTKSREAVEEKQQLNYVPLENVDKDSPAVNAANYLVKVLEKMGVGELTVKVADVENGAQLLFEGENLGVVIGRRGETLDSLQYLASFVANSGRSGKYFRIVLDIGNYREKREDTLKTLAKRMAAQALKSGRTRSLEPMNPYERRIIHTVVQDIDGVVSHSVGDGINRHVVICPEGVTPRYGRNDRNDRRRGGRGDRGNRRPSNAVESPKREPRSDDSGDAPLYGRIG